MVVNNWFITVDMYSKICGEGSIWWVRSYFVSFWIVIVLIQMNILIAIVLEIFGTVAEKVSDQTLKRNAKIEMSRMLRHDNPDQMRLRIEEAKQIIALEEARLE